MRTFMSADNRRRIMKRIFGFFPIFILLVGMAIAGCATPLMNVMEKGDTKEMERLLASGTDVNERWFDNYTPLHFAAFYSQANVAALLIEKGADLNAKDNYGRTPLYVAAWYGKADVVTLLLKKGADPAIATNEGKTPLMIAKEEGNTTIAKILTDAE